MTTRPAEEARLRLPRSPGALGLSWLGAPATLAVAAGAVVLLLGGLWQLLREKPPPLRSGDLPPRRIAAQIAAAQEKLKADPHDLAALVELGTLRFQSGKELYLEAINDLEEARDLGALDDRIFYSLGVMYQEEGLYPFALTEYKRFLRHHPEDKEVRLLAAKLYYRMGLFPDAAAEYERLKFQEPQDPLIEENLGLSLWGAKLVSRAVGSFVQLKAAGGDYARRAEFYLGQIALEAGRFQEAYDHFAKVGPEPLIGLEPQRPPTGLAMAAQKLGKWEEARQAWEAVLKASPGDPKAASALREATHRSAAARRASEAAVKKAEAAKKAVERKMAAAAARKK